ncbi:MAG: type I-E CRISPR-associated protein Cas5/CasD [Kiritimatiellae bacterium]|nr:type I-E CRISPR-associated protein Cas5/CasD [Kiritimatiellia bacterium]
MSDRAYLALYFDAPLQSWGYASKFDRRTSLAHPTRSGVIGLLCAASGIDRTDVQGLERLEKGLDVDVYAYALGSRLTDYHTVGGGYDTKRDAQKICRKASGGTGTTVQTWREYLEDSRFGVVVSGETNLIRELGRHLEDPVWGVWFGRKACVPAARVFEGVHAEEDSALRALESAAGGRKPVRTVRAAAAFDEGTDTLMDRPLDFSLHTRRFAPRRIRVE